MKFTSLFHRRESNVPVIDGIRAIAILWVVLFHAWIIQVFDMPEYIMQVFNYPILNWISKGDLGVDLFFVISGFLIGGIIFREIKSTGTFVLRRFYYRRFLRLTPAYVFAILMNMLLTSNFDFGLYWSNILYVNNYVHDTPMIWTWSLAMEEQFYLLTPLLLLLLFPRFKNKSLFFALFTIVALCVNTYYVVWKLNLSLPLNVVFPTPEWFSWFNDYYRISHLRFIGLLSGVAAAFVHVHHTDRLKEFFAKKSKVVTPLTLLALASFFFIGFTPLGEWNKIPASIFYSLPDFIGKAFEITNKGVFSYAVAYIILACLYDSGTWLQPLRKLLSWKGFYPIAQLSYSAYLFHVMWMFWAFPKLFAAWNGTMDPTTLFFLRYGIGIGGTFIMAAFMYYAIEQPFLQLRNMLSFKKFRYKGWSLGPAGEEA